MIQCVTWNIWRRLRCMIAGHAYRVERELGLDGELWLCSSCAKLICVLYERERERAPRAVRLVESSPYEAGPY